MRDQDRVAGSSLSVSAVGGGGASIISGMQGAMGDAKLEAAESDHSSNPITSRKHIHGQICLLLGSQCSY